MTLKKSPADYLDEAQRLYRNGDYAQAIIYLFSHQLLQLDRRHWLRLVKGKTNRQYLREVRRSASPHAAELADQRTPYPDRAGLVEEVAHLRCHVPESRRRAEDDGVVVRQLLDVRERRGLLELETRRTCNIERHELRDALHHDLHAGHARDAFGLCVRHGLDVPVAAVVEDEDLTHRPARWVRERRRDAR